MDGGYVRYFCVALRSAKGNAVYCLSVESMQSKMKSWSAIVGAIVLAGFTGNVVLAERNKSTVWSVQSVPSAVDTMTSHTSDKSLSNADARALDAKKPKNKVKTPQAPVPTPVVAAPMPTAVTSQNVTSQVPAVVPKSSSKTKTS